MEQNDEQGASYGSECTLNEKRVIRYIKNDDWGVLISVQRTDRMRDYSFELGNISASSKVRMMRVIDTLKEKSTHNLYRRKDGESFSFDEAIDNAKDTIERMRLRKQQYLKEKSGIIE